MKVVWVNIDFCVVIWYFDMNLFFVYRVVIGRYIESCFFIRKIDVFVLNYFYFNFY